MRSLRREIAYRLTALLPYRPSMPPAEQRALLLLLALAVAGQGVRHFATKPGESPGQVQLLATLSRGSPLAQRDSAMRQGRPLAPGERIDVDRAPVTELGRLPKVGPRLAKVIQADRASHGPFGSLSGLDRVAGIGPGLLKVLEPHVVFGGAGAGAAGQRDGATAPSASHEASCGPQASARLSRCPTGLGASLPLNINTATITELDALPGIGPAKAAAILQYRQEHGPLGSIEELVRVPGFGPAAVARLRDRLTAQ